MPLFKKAKVSPLDAPDGPWAVGKSTHEEQSMYVRIHSGMAPSAGHAGFSIQLGVAVPFVHPDPDGLPSPDELEQLAEIEDRLVTDLESTKRAVLTAVVTVGGMREFVFYTGSSDWIQDWLYEFSSATEGHEIQAMSQPDPDWNVWRSFLPERSSDVAPPPGSD